MIAAAPGRAQHHGTPIVAAHRAPATRRSREGTEGEAMSVAMGNSLTNRMVRAAQLDAELYEEVERDTSAIGQAATVVIIAAIAGAIGSGVRDGVLDGVVAAVGTVIGWVLWSAITYVVGKSLFGTQETQVDLGEMLRALGFSYTPAVLNVLGFVPILGPLVALAVAIWQLIAGVIAVRQAMDFGTGRAIGTVIVGWLVQFAVVFVIALFFI
jgi:hypothetical protein